MAHNLPSAQPMSVDELFKLIRANSETRSPVGQNAMPNAQFSGQTPDPLGLLDSGSGSGNPWLQSQGTKLWGGPDPTSGINWNTGRQGVGGIGGKLGMTGMLGK